MSATTPDLLKLLEAGKFKESEAILDSSEYTRKEKIAMILDTREKSGECLFSAICDEYLHIPLNLFIKVLRILGEILSKKKSIARLKCLLEADEIEMKDKICLLRVVVEELKYSIFAVALSSLLTYALGNNMNIQVISVLLESKPSVMMKQDIEYSYCSIKGNILWVKNRIYESYREGDDDGVIVSTQSTLLEIALMRREDIDKVKLLIKAGGKDLLSLSKLSLLKGVIAEYKIGSQRTFEILKCLLEVGGITLILDEAGWLENYDDYYDMQGMNFFQFLSSKLVSKYTRESSNKKAIFDDIAAIMKLVIETGKEDLVLAKNRKGEFLFHDFKYFQHSEFSPVLRRILDIGGVDILNMRDKHGETVLHSLARYQGDVLEDYSQNLTSDKKTMWNLLRCTMEEKESLEKKLKNKKNVFMQERYRLQRKLEHENEAFYEVIEEYYNTIDRLQNELENKNDDSALQRKVREQQSLIKNLQDERKQADLDFEIVKTMHEENKNTYDGSLVEIGKLKELNKSQQNDIRDQKETIKNLHYELRQKDEEYESRLRKLEDDNQRLRELVSNSQKISPGESLSMQEESHRLIEEIKVNIDEDSEQRIVTELREEIHSLKDAVKVQKRVAEEKEKENEALKNENENLYSRIATSCIKRSRNEDTKEIDCIEEEEEDGIYCPSSKRGKTTTSSFESKASENARTRIESLESEIEEMIDQLENEKANHSKTLKRLKEARRVSKNN
ncbi:predicted protein [Chaetoceros tenuissimus]|uniref:Uncharacterized protein n=1 Tax=Chaetoceros tenuissimus TaxID=426638 RepID=A0AAD3GZK9_9STRA|nr:predicted protein [Chaetoceros tenuissimus]